MFVYVQQKRRQIYDHELIIGVVESGAERFEDESMAAVYLVASSIRIFGIPRKQKIVRGRFWDRAKLREETLITASRTQMAPATLRDRGMPAVAIDTSDTNSELHLHVRHTKKKTV